VDIRAITRLRNDAMISARERLGKSQRAAAAEAGVALERWVDLEKLNYAGCSSAYLEEIAVAIAVYLGLAVDEIAPDEVLGLNLTSTVVQTRTVSTQVLLEATTSRDRRLCLPDPIITVERAETVKAIKTVLKTLSFREREVLTLRYGLDESGKECTIEECGRIFRVTPGRVRQIEERAIRKLQNPARANRLKGAS